MPSNPQLQAIETTYRELARLEGIVRVGSLSLEDAAIMALLNAVQRTTTGAIAAAVGLSPSKATRCMRSLSKLGLVVESVDREDSRKCVYRLSSRGSNVLFEVEQRFGASDFACAIERFEALLRARRACLGPGAPSSDTAQRLLLALHASEGPLCIKELCGCVAIAQSKASMAMGALCDKGLAVKVEKSDDLRKQRYELTGEGGRVARRMADALGFLVRAKGDCQNASMDENPA